MPDIEVSGPDGSSFTFPEGTSSEKIKSAMQSHYGGAKKQETISAPTYDPFGGAATGYTQQAPAGPGKETLEFERREGPFGYAKEYGKGATAFTLGAIPEMTVNLPSNLYSMATYLPTEGTKAFGRGLEKIGAITPQQYEEGVKQVEAFREKLRPSRVGYGVPETSKYLFGEPQGPVATGMRTAGEILGPPAPTALLGFARPSQLEQTLQAATGLSARTRSAAQELVGGVVTQQQKASERLEQSLTALNKALEQLGQRDVVAAQRAAGRALNPNEVAGIQSAVTNRVRDAARQAERDALATGMKADEAAAHASRVADQLIEAETAVARLETELLSKPQMRPEEFGARVRAAAEALREKYSTIRSQEAGFDQAIASAGNKLIVDTSGIQNYINKVLKDTRNPQIEAVLREINFQLATPMRGQDVAALNIRAVDSLRKYINTIRGTKQITYRNGTKGDAADAIKYLDEIVTRLEKAAGKAHAPYNEALRKYAELSRPLDIVQRKGPLRQVIETDLLSKEFLQGEAAVAGRVIQRAKEGHPVFTRLLAENPELQNAARLYFNRELFGRGRVPTVDSLASFLKENEGVLRQLNLYDEFSTIEKARRTADTAVKTLKVEQKAAKETVGELLGETKGLEKEAARTRKLVEEAKRREAATREAVPTAEELAKAGEKRALQAESKLQKKVGETSTEKAKTEAIADKYNRMEVELAAARPEEVARRAKDIAVSMRKDNLVDDVNYYAMLKQIQMVEDRYKDVEQARAMTGNILQRFLVSAATKMGRGALGK